MKNVKGTYDYLPKEQLIREEIIGTLREGFQTYGFNPIETPMLCLRQVLASKYAGGAEILKETYTLSDQGSRELGLRYDLTVPLARFFGMNKNQIALPFKKYEIGKVFRDGPIKLGRKREFYQADVDVIGVKSFFAELEFFKLIDFIAQRLKLKVVVKYNSRQILTDILKGLGVDNTMLSSVILTIDKLEKLTREEIVSELLNKGMQEARINQLLDILKQDYDSIITFCDKGEVSKEQTDFIAFKNYVDTMERSSYTRFAFTPSLARGLEVYTGAIWEVYIDEKSAISSSIGAGGRYDKIIGKFLGEEKEYPAVGMTFGVDVLMEIIKERQSLESKVVTDVLLVPMSCTEINTLEIADRLRYLGLKVDVDFSGRKLKRSLNYADKQGIRFVSIIGEDEIKNGSIKLRDMNSGKEKILDLDNLSDILDLNLSYS